MEQSVLTKLLAEVNETGNYGASEKRSREIVTEVENIIEKRALFYFASEAGIDEGSLITDEDAFVIENLLSVPTEKKDLVLVLHSNGGLAISAERIIGVCRSYCKKQGAGNKFLVLIPKKAKSAGTILALGAHNIYLRETAELGPVDPQFSVIDNAGNRTFTPAYLHVDAIENLIPTSAPLSIQRVLSFFVKNGKSLIELPENTKNKLLEQCNYPLYVNSKNELGLSDSIIEKIAREKIAENPNVQARDFDIFIDPHLTKSHGRLIGLKDLQESSLCREKIICGIESMFTDSGKTAALDALLWELYVRKRRLLNDAGNQVVKTIEGSGEFFSLNGRKIGQV